MFKLINTRNQWHIVASLSMTHLCIAADATLYYDCIQHAHIDTHRHRCLPLCIATTANIKGRCEHVWQIVCWQCVSLSTNIHIPLGRWMASVSQSPQDIHDTCNNVSLLLIFDNNNSFGCTSCKLLGLLFGLNDPNYSCLFQNTQGAFSDVWHFCTETVIRVDFVASSNYIYCDPAVKSVLYM